MDQKQYNRSVYPQKSNLNKQKFSLDLFYFVLIYHFLGHITRENVRNCKNSHFSWDTISASVIGSPYWYDFFSPKYRGLTL